LQIAKFQIVDCQLPIADLGFPLLENVWSKVLRPPEKGLEIGYWQSAIGNRKSPR
jgi:hypothetical protein